MPEHLRALVVILALATAVFALAKAPACALASTTGDFVRRRNLWFGITLAAFLSHNYWIYTGVVAALLVFAVRREENRLAMFFFLLFAVPAISVQISGMGVIEHLFTIHYVRLLSLAVLVPAFLHLRKRLDTEPFGRSVPDVLIAIYLVLQFFVQLRDDTLTNSLRHGVFYAFSDIFLPYYVASRSLKNLAEFRDVLMAFVTGAMVLSAIGAFEAARLWHLYNALRDALQVPWGVADYLARGGILRAQASAGHPIVLGYVTAVAFGFFLFLRRSVPNQLAWSLGLTLLLVGLIAPVSRGPWVGAAAMLLVFVATGPSPVLGIARLGLLGAIVLLAMLATPAGEKLFDLLPFVGTVEEGNITYRQRLLQTSIQVMMQNPFFGTVDYLYSPAMQSLRQGQGIIDVVNTYLGVGLASGLVGLALFSGFFISVAFGIYRGMRALGNRNGELHLLGQALLATLIGILVIIFTVSSISSIPIVYWSVAGLGVAFARTLARAKAPASAVPVRDPRATTEVGA